MGGCTYLEKLEADPEFLYHGTSEAHLANIVGKAIRPPSHWSRSYEMALYYGAAAGEEDGGDAVVLRVAMTRFSEQDLVEDRAAAQEPITTVLGPQEEKIFQAWERVEGSWRDSLALLDSVIYQGQELVIYEDEVYEVESLEGANSDLVEWNRERPDWERKRKGLPSLKVDSNRWNRNRLALERRRHREINF